MWFLFVMLLIVSLAAISGGSIGTYIGYVESDVRFIGFGIGLAMTSVLTFISAVVIFSRLSEDASQSKVRQSQPRVVQTDEGVVTRLNTDETILLVTMRKLHSQGRIKLVYERSGNGSNRAVYLDNKPLMTFPNENSNNTTK